MIPITPIANPLIAPSTAPNSMALAVPRPWAAEPKAKPRAIRLLIPKRSRINGPTKQPGKYQVDLWEANRKELLACGVKNENIEVAGMCSVCHPDLFFSYRREGEKAGRFGAGIGMKS